jgi:hypothetical protein
MPTPQVTTQHPFTVTITDPQRAAEWQQVLGTTTLPVTSFIPTPANLPGIGAAYAYKLKLELLTHEQRDSLIAHIAQKFSRTPEEVAQGLDEHGVPLLADDCVVAVFNPQKWL